VVPWVRRSPDGQLGAIAGPDALHVGIINTAFNLTPSETAPVRDRKESTLALGRARAVLPPALEGAHVVAIHSPRLLASEAARPARARKVFVAIASRSSSSRRRE
jgi:hypothetical protein